ncbi:MAG: sulfotransferase family protein [Synechococcus sp.]
MKFFPFQLFKRPNRAEQVKIFGIGNLKTGTTSLGAALETLGFQHTHAKRGYLLDQLQRGNLENVLRWVDRYESFEDWPYPLIYKEMDFHFPKSRFILTTRANAEVWLNSMIRHAEKVGPTVGREKFFGFAMPQGHEADYVARYNQHNQEVRDYFKDRPGKLLEVCWENGDSWEEICSFLGVPVPVDKAFPIINTATNRINK